MSLKIKFVNGVEQVYLDAVETEEYFNGSSRRTLTFVIARSAANLEELDALCTEENLAKLELTNEEQSVTHIHEGYVLKLKLGLEQQIFNRETNTYEEYILLKLGKRTYIEEKLYQLGIQ